MNLINKLTTVFLLVGNLAFCQDWVKTDITNFATIDFPIESKLIENQGEIIFSATDDYAAYIVSLRKLTKQQSSQLTEDEIPNLYEGVINGAIQAANATLLSRKDIDMNGSIGLEVEYLASANPELPSLRYKRVFYINQHIINIDFLPLTNQKNISEEKKNQFFNSFSADLNKFKKEQEVSTNPTNTKKSESKPGYYIGQIFFFLILIGFLIGILFLIKLFIRKKKNQSSVNQTPKQTKAKIIKIICHECEAENNSTSKYCNSCGYELQKNNESK